MTTATAVACSPAGRRAPKRVLPGFGLSLGYTLFYLRHHRADPAVSTDLQDLHPHREQFWAAISAPRVLASYR